MSDESLDLLNFCFRLMRCCGVKINRSQQRTIVNCMSINEDNVMVSAGL
jgi:hypothetical protein